MSFRFAKNHLALPDVARTFVEGEVVKRMFAARQAKVALLDGFPVESAWGSAARKIWIPHFGLPIA